jgi:hypothetical protein
MSLLFPELAVAEEGGGQRPAASSGEPRPGQIVADDAETGTAPISAAAAPSAAHHTRTRGQVEGNEECVRAFSAAFRLPVPFRAVRLMSDGTVRMELATADDGERRSIFLVEPTADHWKRGPGFAIAFSGKQLPASFHAPLLKFLVRYQRTSLQAFAGRVRALASTRSDSNAAAGLQWPNAEDDPLRLDDDVDHALFRSYGIATAWRTFFEDHDLYRGSCTQLRGNVASIMHRDIECESSYAPDNVWGMGTFAGLATDPEGEPPAGTDYDSLTFDTHLGDRDVILGGDSRLDAALTAIAAMPRRPDLVLLNSTCISVVTGDDLEASAARAGRKHGLVVTSLGCVEHPVQDTLISQLAAIERAPVARATVLVGAPCVAGIRSVLSTLRAVGVEIDGPLLPDLPAGFSDSIGRASLFVVYDQPHTRRSVRQLLEQFPDVAVLAPPPPFGFEATRAFCFGVAAACGVEEEMQRYWNERYAPLESRWRTLVARASRYRVAFVSDHPDWKARLWTRLGVPLLETIRAMHFDVEVLAYASDGAAVAESIDPGILVRRFTSEEELTMLLRESAAPLVYSEIRYDPRVTRTGHASVSLEDFRCGIEGSFTTLEALIRRCEQPWFRRYGVLATTAPISLQAAGASTAQGPS